MEKGEAKLDNLPGISAVFCKHISLNAQLYDPSSPISILLTVTWDNYTNAHPHDAVAPWSEDVSARGFKACVMIAGRHFNQKLDSPFVYWVSTQNSVMFGSKNSEDGTIHMKTWYTGSRCQSIPIKVYYCYKN